MATQEEVFEKLTSRLQEVRRHETVWGDITAAIAAADSQTRTRLINAVRDGDYEAVGDISMHLILNYTRGQAEQEVNQMLADNKLTLEDLQRIL